MSGAVWWEGARGVAFRLRRWEEAASRGAPPALVHLVRTCRRWWMRESYDEAVPCAATSKRVCPGDCCSSRRGVPAPRRLLSIGPNGLQQPAIAWRVRHSPRGGAHEAILPACSLGFCSLLPAVAAVIPRKPRLRQRRRCNRPALPRRQRKLLISRPSSLRTLLPAHQAARAGSWGGRRYPTSKEFTGSTRSPFSMTSS